MNGSGSHCDRMSAKNPWGINASVCVCVFALVGKWQPNDRNVMPFTGGLQLPPGAPTSYRPFPSSTVNGSLQHSQQLWAVLLPVAASVTSYERAEKDNSFCLEWTQFHFQLPYTHKSVSATYLVSLRSMNDKGDLSTIRRESKQKGKNCVNV